MTANPDADHRHADVSRRSGSRPRPGDGDLVKAGTSTRSGGRAASLGCCLRARPVSRRSSTGRRPHAAGRRRRGCRALRGRRPTRRSTDRRGARRDRDPPRAARGGSRAAAARGLPGRPGAQRGAGRHARRALPDVVGEKVLHRANPVGSHRPRGAARRRARGSARCSEAAPGTPSSSHHQAIRRRWRPASTPRPTPPTGSIEAVELRVHPWLFAVQWHPEVSAASRPGRAGLFDGLVAAGCPRRDRSTYGAPVSRAGFCHGCKRERNGRIWSGRSLDPSRFCRSMEFSP